jgi:hypothetical protein
MPVAAGLVAVVLTVGVGVAVTRSAWVRHELRLSFTRVDRPYPELFFSGAAPLPVGARPGSIVSVPFSVTNVAGSSHAYQWSATVQRADGAETPVGAGTIRQAAHETAGATVTFTVPRGARVFSVRLHGWRTPIFFHFIGGARS